MKKKMDKQVFELFKVMVLNKGQSLATKPVLDHGMAWAANFNPNTSQSTFLKSVTAPLDVNTLFTREERETVDPFVLISHQLNHYIKTYGLGWDGQDDLVVNGQIVTLTYVRGVTEDELKGMIQDLLYANAPVKDAIVVRDLVRHYGVEYNFAKIANNEVRIALFDPAKDTLTDGDDVVRYLVETATGQPMVIKSREVIDGMNLGYRKISADFIARHEQPLARVFNRHKRLILALKRTPELRRAINRITRLSKKAHKPLHTGINKRFLALALNDAAFDMGVLDQIGVRDKLKFLNVLGYKRAGSNLDAFVVRNGKIHVRDDRKVYDAADIDRVENAVLTSLKKDLAHLKGETILLDGSVHYGLPITRKQTLGNLPFGTTVKMDGGISAGVYWENSWGATDLDLSTIDVDGTRTGWGSYRGYAAKDVVYSGDVTNATNGAMEFMTSNGASYGLFVNIYSGQTGAETELVIGTDNGGRRRWMTDVKIREKTSLASRGMVLGFTQGSDFVVYQGRMTNNRVSGGRQPIVERGMAQWWTVNDLFDALDIDYSLDREAETCYDHDLSYNGVSYDKLEKLLLN